MADFIVLIILIFLSGFFSASEIAIFSLSEAKIKSLEKKHGRQAIILAKLKSNPQRLLINILIGNNLVNISASAIATVLAYDFFGSAGPAIATGILTAAILIFGEVGPKSFASSRPENFALFVSPILKFLDLFFRPLTIMLESLNKTVIQVLTKGKKTPSVSEDEIKALAEIGAKEGVVEPKEKEMIKKILEFKDINASDVMVTRSEVFAFPAKLTVSEAVLKINQAHFSRIPVYNKNIDDIVGVVYLPDVLREYTKGNVDMSLAKIARKPYFVPKQRKIDEIFKDFQRQRIHMAIVVDQKGLTLGLVTLEDLLEEIVGEIMDESDVDEFLIKRVNKFSVVVDAGVEAREVNNFLNVKIPGDEHDSISEIFLDKFGRIPKPGDEIIFKGLKMVVEKATAKKIEKVRIIKS